MPRFKPKGKQPPKKAAPVQDSGKLPKRIASAVVSGMPMQGMPMQKMPMKEKM